MSIRFHSFFSDDDKKIIDFAGMIRKRPGPKAHLPRIRHKHNGTPAFRATGLLVGKYHPFQAESQWGQCNWHEIVRIGNTQKIVTTYGTNKAGVVIGVRKCSEPSEPLKNIQSILLMKSRLFAKRTCLSGKQESVVHKPESQKIESHYHKGLSPP